MADLEARFGPRTGFARYDASIVDRRSVIATYRLGFGLLTLVAMAVQLADLASSGTLDLVNYFSYFTIQSNLIAATLLLIGAARWRAPRSSALDFARGGAVVYMSVTGIVFTLLLSGTDVDTAIPWVNTVVHELMPMVIIVDWLLDPPEGRLTIRQGLLWLAYPLAWIIYTLIRGSLVNRYPYPFLDPANGGYGSVLVYCVAILVLMWLVLRGDGCARECGGWSSSQSGSVSLTRRTSTSAGDVEHSEHFARPEIGKQATRVPRRTCIDFDPATLCLRVEIRGER